MYKINDIEMPTPKVFDQSHTTLEGLSERNLAGNIMRDIVAQKREISVEYPPMEFSKCQQILQAIDHPFFNVTYIDAVEGETTKRFYVSDRSIPAQRYIDGEMLWAGLTFQLNEQ